MEFEYRDILKVRPSVQEFLNLATLGKIEMMDLVNKKSKTYRDLKTDISDFNPQQVAELLVENPKMMYRPLFADHKNLVVGFKPELLQALNS